MTPIFNWLSQHQATTSVVAFWLFSALVSGMPPTTTASGLGYVWLYNSLHILSSNLDTLFQKRLPAAPPAGKP